MLEGPGTAVATGAGLNPDLIRLEALPNSDPRSSCGPPSCECNRIVPLKKANQQICIFEPIAFLDVRYGTLGSTFDVFTGGTPEFALRPYVAKACACGRGRPLRRPEPAAVHGPADVAEARFARLVTTVIKLKN
jgi:hypothetical protein